MPVLEFTGFREVEPQLVGSDASSMLLMNISCWGGSRCNPPQSFDLLPCRNAANFMPAMNCKIQLGSSVYTVLHVTSSQLNFNLSKGQERLPGAPRMQEKTLGGGVLPWTPLGGAYSAPPDPVAAGIRQLLGSRGDYLPRPEEPQPPVVGPSGSARTPALFNKHSSTENACV